MPAPTLITDLSTTQASNYPSGSDNVFPSLDDTLRALSGFLASIRDNSGNGWVSPYLPAANPSYTGTLTGGTGVVALGTNQFYKDASGNVGIGTASPGAKLDVVGTAAISGAVTLSGGTANGIGYLNGSKVLTTGSALTFDGNLGTTGNIYLKTAGTKLGWDVSGVYFNWIESGGTSGADYLRFAIANTEAMRLTSTGLGIGTSSPYSGTKLTLQESASNPGGLAIRNRNSTQTWQLSVDAAAVDDKILAFIDPGAGAVRMALDSSGNLGLGVTPSAWSGIKPIQAGTAASFSGGSGFNDAFVASNAFYDGANWKYINTNPAYYASVGGSAAARWYTAPSGTAGNAITFTQAMTLDASGNLGVGTTSPVGKFEVSASDAGAVATRITNTANVSQYLSIQMSGGTAFGVPGWDNSGVIEAVADGVGSGTRALYLSAYNGPLIFATGSGSRNERARITSDGNLGVGTTAPTNFGAAFKTVAVNGSSGGMFEFQVAGSSAGYLTADASALSILASGSRAISLYTNGSERARITSGGDLLVGTTATPAINVKGNALQNFANQGRLVVGATISTADLAYFYSSTALAGAITVNGSTCTYTSFSDYRLKEDVAPMTGALDKVTALKPVTYKWKTDGLSGQGFIAHELQAVVPECVTGEKDAVDADGNPAYQGIDTSFLVATLTAAIQEQQALITSITARVASLEVA